LSLHHRAIQQGNNPLPALPGITMKIKANFSHYCALLYCLLPLPVLADVDTNSEAYKSGQSAGRLIAYAILAVIVFMVIRKIFKK
jgi:hypothetical protein